MEKSKRPIYLDLPKLGSKMSVTAKVSILHRASGVLMFLALPFVLLLLHLSLTNHQVYAVCYAMARSYPAKISYLVLLWALLHHMCAGIRFLLLDIHCGVERLTAQKTARWVLVISLALTAILGAIIW